MRIAIPTIGKYISDHFGRCEKYIFIDTKDNKLIEKFEKASPKHAPSVIPKFLKDEGVDIVITSGIGQKALALFNSFDIKVLTGVTGEVEEIIKNYLAGSLSTGESTCNHEEEC
jgi:predicted Fe-Mo cluster-binding NifX family protein